MSGQRRRAPALRASSPDEQQTAVQLDADLVRGGNPVAMSKGKKPSLVEALNRTYRERGAELRNIVRRGASDDGADVVHDAVVKTLEAGKGSEIRDPVHFLFHVTRNTLLDRFRSKARRGRVLEYGLEDADAVDEGPTAERALIASQRLRRAMSIIEHMPPRRREAFLLCRIEELTYAQAGRRMGVTVHAIEKHVSAAMAQLFAEFEAD